MYFAEQLAHVFDVHRIEIGERVKEALVFAGGIQAPFDAELVHAVNKAEAVHAHAYGANQAALVGIDFVCRRRHVIAARSADVLDHRIYGDVRVLLAQPVDFVVDIAGLHGAAARTVDA